MMTTLTKSKSLMFQTTFALFLGLAQSATADIRNLGEQYLMELQIGQKKFKDFVIFEKVSQRSQPLGYIVELGGSVTVPTVFTVPLKGELEHRFSFVADPTSDLNFTIMAVENGKTFQVTYKATLDSHGMLHGKAFLENDQPLGDFVAYPLRVDQGN